MARLLEIRYNGVGFTATFDREMLASTLRSGWTISAGARIARATPRGRIVWLAAEGLQDSTTYTVAVPEGASGADGTPLMED